MFTKLTVEAEPLCQLPSRLTTGQSHARQGAGQRRELDTAVPVRVRASGENRTEPCPSGRGPFRWLFSPLEPDSLKRITKQSQLEGKPKYFNNLSYNYWG